MGRMSQLLGLINDLDENLGRDDIRSSQRLELKTFRSSYMRELLDLRYKYIRTKTKK